MARVGSSASSRATTSIAFVVVSERPSDAGGLSKSSANVALSLRRSSLNKTAVRAGVRTSLIQRAMVASRFACATSTSPGYINRSAKGVATAQPPSSSRPLPASQRREKNATWHAAASRSAACNNDDGARRARSKRTAARNCVVVASESPAARADAIFGTLSSVDATTARFVDASSALDAASTRATCGARAPTNTAATTLALVAWRFARLRGSSPAPLGSRPARSKTSTKWSRASSASRSAGSCSPSARAVCARSRVRCDRHASSARPAATRSALGGQSSFRSSRCARDGSGSHSASGRPAAPTAAATDTTGPTHPSSDP
mmetsp:Transcript_21528/g.66131  ORF Transcript_21528/g.66131 Transcript_21528/m.66131 type:complete len:320 (+) Transcript_21528:38-997(+)